MHPIASLTLALAVAWVVPSWARQDPAPVRQAVEDYLRIQTQGLPAQVSFSVGAIDPNNGLAPCAALEVGQAAGSRLWGRGNVTVRCARPNGWSMFVPIHVRVVADYVITARPLAQGQVLADGDLAAQQGDLTELPAGILTDSRQALGRTAAMSVPAGRPLRADMLRQAFAVKQGQGVKVLYRGQGFEVANEGRALNNAAEGQVAQVRLANGQIISGIARAGGIVDVGF